MGRRFLCGLLFVCATAWAAAPAWETGVVTFQTVDTVPVGAIGRSSTTGSVTGFSTGDRFQAYGEATSRSRIATVFGQWNTVEILTDSYRYRLQELATGLRSLGPMRRGPAHPIILPVNQRISFYREKGAFIMLDTTGHRHAFERLGMESLEGGVFAPDENTAAGHFAIGERSMAEKNYIDALIEYRWALELAPDNPTVEQRIKAAEDEVDAQDAAKGR